MLYKFKNFFINLWNYKKFLWENRFYDSHYIFFMLREKLNTDIKYYKRYGSHLYVERDISQMVFCVKLLNRIIDDDYLDNSLMFFEKKYPDWINYALTENCGYDIKWFLRCSKIADRQKQQDIDYLFRYMNKHIISWWD